MASVPKPEDTMVTYLLCCKPKSGFAWGCASVGLVSLLEILKAISDGKSLRLLNLMARGDEPKERDISRKEFYSRISRFVKTGMVGRRHGKHFLTPFGKTIYEIQLILVEEVKLKAAVPPDRNVGMLSPVFSTIV